jgi:hypothetical protein
MKHTNLTLTVTAAMLTLAATTAFGQKPSLTAKVPFAFRAAGTDLPAGRYAVAPPQGSLGTSGTMEIRNLDTGKAIFLPAKNSPLAEKTGKPRLIFQCSDDGGCSLATAWSGQGSGLEFNTPALTASQKERRETIYLERFTSK